MASGILVSLFCETSVSPLIGIRYHCFVLGDWCKSIDWYPVSTFVCEIGVSPLIGIRYPFALFICLFALLPIPKESLESSTYDFKRWTSKKFYFLTHPPFVSLNRHLHANPKPGKYCANILISFQIRNLGFRPLIFQTPFHNTSLNWILIILWPSFVNKS